MTALSDHDLLIRLDEKITLLLDRMEPRVAKLEKDALTKSAFAWFTGIVGSIMGIGAAFAEMIWHKG